MPGSSSWMPYAAQGVKGFDDTGVHVKYPLFLFDDLNCSALRTILTHIFISNRRHSKPTVILTGESDTIYRHRPYW